MNIKILIVLLMLFICGCVKDDNPCDTIKEGENYFLSDSAKKLVSNYSQSEIIIFRTNNGNEVPFTVSERDTIGGYQVVFPCEFDSLQSQRFHGNSQLLRYKLINDSIFLERLMINLFTLPELPSQQATENLTITKGEPFSNEFKTEDELFFYVLQSDNSHLIYLDSVVLNDKTFYSVYKMNNLTTSPNITIKYTKNEGIIYIKDSQSSIEYTFERAE